MDYGTKVLERVLKKIQNMTSEEYTALYESCMRDIKECPEILDINWFEGAVCGNDH